MPERVPCPICAELIMPGAKKCRFCGHWLAPSGQKREAGISAGVVQDARDLADDPQLHARQFFLHLEHPVMGTSITERPPIRFLKELGMPRKPAPLLGEDNRYVFIDLLGFTESEYAAYTKKGIIR